MTWADLETVLRRALARREDIFQRLHAALVPFHLLTAHYAFASSNR
ncbi:MAG: hypothetical protein ACR2PL_19225 [Dehalococcoidia bacterium]